MSASDVDWATVAQVAAKLGESLTGVRDHEVGEPSGTVGGLRERLAELPEIAERAAAR